MGEERREREARMADEEVPSRAAISVKCWRSGVVGLLNSVQEL